MIDEEQELKKPSKFSLKVWKRIFSYFKEYKKDFIVIFALILVMAAVDIAYPVLQAYVVDHYVMPAVSGGIWAFAAVYFAVAAVQVIFIAATLRVCIRLEMSVSRALRNAMFMKYQELPVGWYNDKSVGYLVAKTMSDTERIAAMAAWQFFDFTWNALYTAGIFIPIFILSARLGFVLLGLIPLSILVSVLFSKRLLKMNRGIRKANSDVAGALNEGITGAKTSKTLVIEPLLTKEFGALTDTMYRKSNRFNRLNSFYSSVLIALGLSGVAFIVAIGGRDYLGGTLSLGAVTALLAYTSTIAWPIMQLAAGVTSVTANQANAERILSVLDETAAVRDTPDVLEKYGDSYNPKRENWEPLTGDVEFVNVSFRYPGSETWILRDFNLKIPAGTTLALVGETGAGKTTIVNLLCRFYEPDEGQILIDGADYRRRSLAWLSAHTGYVLQSPHLFSGTIRQNIKYGRPDATDEEAERAAKLVFCDRVAAKLEKGWDSETGECGDRLSTGEKQLISFARAVLADPRIFILDEATSSIDTETEYMLQQAIAEMLKNRTSVLIAHRLSTIKNADMILLIEEGKPVERGTHKELIAAKGKYYELYSRLSELDAADKILKT